MPLTLWPLLVRVVDFYWTLQFPPIPLQCPGSRLDSMSYAASSVSGTREKNFPGSASHAAPNVVQNTAALWCQCMVSSFSLKSTFSISETTFSISACRDAGSHSSSGEELCISLYWTSWGFYCYNPYIFEMPLSWRCHLLCELSQFCIFQWYAEDAHLLSRLLLKYMDHRMNLLCIPFISSSEQMLNLWSSLPSKPCGPADF